MVDSEQYGGGGEGYGRRRIVGEMWGEKVGRGVFLRGSGEGEDGGGGSSGDGGGSFEGGTSDQLLMLSLLLSAPCSGAPPEHASPGETTKIDNVMIFFSTARPLMFVLLHAVTTLACAVTAHFISCCLISPFYDFATMFLHCLCTLLQ